MISPSKSPSKSTFGDAVDDGGAAAVACVACADGTPDNKSPSKLELVVLVGVYVVLVTGGSCEGVDAAAVFGPPNKSLASFCFLCSDSEISSSLFAVVGARGGGDIVGNGCCCRCCCGGCGCGCSADTSAADDNTISSSFTSSVAIFGFEYGLAPFASARCVYASRAEKSNDTVLVFATFAVAEAKSAPSSGSFAI